MRFSGVVTIGMGFGDPANEMEGSPKARVAAKIADLAVAVDEVE